MFSHYHLNRTQKDRGRTQIWAIFSARKFHNNNFIDKISPNFTIIMFVSIISKQEPSQGHAALIVANDLFQLLWYVSIFLFILRSYIHLNCVQVKELTCTRARLMKILKMLKCFWKYPECPWVPGKKKWPVIIFYYSITRMDQKKCSKLFVSREND